MTELNDNSFLKVENISGWGISTLHSVKVNDLPVNLRERTRELIDIIRKKTFNHSEELKLVGSTASYTISLDDNVLYQTEPTGWRPDETAELNNIIRQYGKEVSPRRGETWER